MKLNPCPFCGSSNIESDCFSGAFGVPVCPEDCYDYCRDCDAQGPAAADVATAHALWNARGSLSVGNMTAALNDESPN
jgi:hypothetical protein